ncbi:MAG TPA: hypothetical protein VF292_10615, partial [Rhodanobacteraceae bacterium]
MDGPWHHLRRVRHPAVRLRALHRGQRSAQPVAADAPYGPSPRAAEPVAAAVLARDHGKLTTAAAFDLDKALAAHDRTLRHAYEVARTAATDNRRVEPAAEWLIDNAFLVRNEIRTIRDALPARVWKRLPRTETERGSVAPRMLRVLRACIARLDGTVEPAAVERYLNEYQQHCALDLIELWTLPVLVRVTLVEGLAACAAT